jgi:endonuclease/exonuclease/phosphatase (EEP) superfamily protein YafD
MLLNIIKIIFLYLALINIGEAGIHKIPPIEESLKTIGKSSNTALNSNSIKVLVWNILKSKRKNWFEDFLEISNNKDFLILQESYINNKYLYFFQNIMDSYQFDMAISFLYLKKYPTGTMIGSKVTPFETGILRTTYLEPIVRTPKTSVYGLYEIEGFNEKLLVISIHGLNLTKDIYLKKQINHVFELITNHKGPVIFAGDFNTRNKRRTYFLKKIMKDKNFKEVIFYKDNRLKVFGYPLDYVFVRGLHIKNSNVLNNIYSSDHKPMVVEFYMN